jgi:hypothetical protein
LECELGDETHDDSVWRRQKCYFPGIGQLKVKVD